MDDAELERRYRDVHLLAATIDAVVLAPRSALPGSCLPDYMIALPALCHYVEAWARGADAAELSRLVLECLPPTKGAEQAEGNRA
jgi:hypothetical protein